MNRSSGRWVSAGTIVLALVWTLRPGAGASAQSTSVPRASGADLLTAKCLACHQIDLIRQQRLDRAGWQREVDKMIRWGAPLTEAERNLLINYLAANVEPSVESTLGRGASTGGAKVFSSACLACHRADIVEQQRLGRTAWIREIEKMIRWGVDVSDSDKDELVDYLSSRFGPRPLEK